MKVLILHASAGAGHKRAAEALGKAFKADNAQADVRVTDILDFTPPIFRKTYAKGYLDIVRTAPELWGYMFSQSDKKATDPARRKIRSLFNRINTPSFLDFFREFAPDVAVCTHFMPLELLSNKTRRHRIDTPFFCTVTDFAVHSLWMLEDVACYYVATDEARRQLVRRGQPENRIEVTGIPIDPVFSSSLPAAKAREKLGLRDPRPCVLLLSGGFGVGPTSDLITALGALPLGCRLLVVAGANEELKKQAEEAAARTRMPVTVFGFVNNIHELMDASDLVISKPGGLTTSEVLAKGKPLLIVDPIPGQEQRNCEYLLEAGAAARLFDIEDAGYKVQTLLSDPKRLARMSQCARRLGKPQAAADIVRNILRRARAPASISP